MRSAPSTTFVFCEVEMKIPTHAAAGKIKLRKHSRDVSGTLHYGPLMGKEMEAGGPIEGSLTKENRDRKSGLRTSQWLHVELCFSLSVLPLVSLVHPPHSNEELNA